MRSIKTYLDILKRKGFRYSIHEFWKQIQRLHWIRDHHILAMEYEDKVYRLLHKYKYVLKQTPQNKAVSENPFPDKIWVCWLQGFEHAPELVKRCLESIRKNSAGREVIELNEENLSKYITFPDYINNKYKKGQITMTHFSDILRINLLAEYGGIWIDATVFLSAPLPDYIFQSPLFCFKNSLLSSGKGKASSWFIAAEAQNKILLETRSLLYEYWRRNNFLKHYFLFHLFFSIASESDEINKKQWKSIHYFNNLNPHVLQFELFDPYNEQRLNEIYAFSAVHKLNYKVSAELLARSEGTFYEKVIMGTIQQI
ncbi:MAG: capsular polysaccharide synthesis protein [Lentimicrobiaceae bacterium]|nr:capsular polysaccharide synthesis protein [Lentimicrobiaceae bacterium]